MGLFDKKDSAAKVDEKAISGEGSAIKNAAGFQNLSDARAAAPASTAGVAAPATAATSKRSTAAANSRQPTKKEIEEAEKQAKQQLALQAAGKYIMARFASMPYEAWAIMAEDEKYKLKDNEAKDLADNYYLLAATVEVDFSKPIWLLVGIAAAHSGFVGERLKYWNDKNEQNDKTKKAQTEQKAQTA